MTKFAFVVIAWLLTHVPAESYRVIDSGFNIDQENRTATQGIGCRNYCVQCSDGSTIFYGRERNWWKAGANTLTAGIGTLAAEALGVGEGSEETHTHWTGNIPTTGFFCERMGVLKFNKRDDCDAVALMRVSGRKFGRVADNMLKPYDSERVLIPGFQQKDKKAYKKGCKILKSSGLKGSWEQLMSIGQGDCSNRVIKGAKMCSQHSRLCGNQGIDGIINVQSADDCLQACALSSNELVCANQS